MSTIVSSAALERSGERRLQSLGITTRTRRNAVNLVGFKIGWVACVGSAAVGLPWLGPAAVLAILALHFALEPEPAREARLLARCLGLGFCVDTTLVAVGALQYESNVWPGPWAAPWILALWLLFASTLNYSLGWLRDRFVVALLFGAIGGPLSYRAGVLLGAVGWRGDWPGIATLSIAWGIAVPLVSYLATRDD